MEFLSHFANAFSDGISGFVGWFSNLFEYFVSIGVRPETLIILLVAGGISFLILLVALFMLMARIKLKRGQVAVEKPAPEKGRREKSSTRFSAMFSPKARGDVEASPKPEKKDAGGGFAIFKKKKKPARPKPSEVVGDGAGPNDSKPLDQVVGKLAEIERDMLALKELFESGHIDAEVYVEETRKLYETAQQYI